MQVITLVTFGAHIIVAGGPESRELWTSSQEPLGSEVRQPERKPRRRRWI